MASPQWNWTKTDEKNDLRQVLAVSKIFLHPDYNTTTIANDIALVPTQNLINFIYSHQKQLHTRCTNYEPQGKTGSKSQPEHLPPCLPSPPGTINVAVNFIALINMDCGMNINIDITIAITIILKFRIKISLVNADGCMVSVTLFWWPFLQLSLSHIPFGQVVGYKLEMWNVFFVTG